MPTYAANLDEVAYPGEIEVRRFCYLEGIRAARDECKKVLEDARMGGDILAEGIEDCLAAIENLMGQFR